MKPDEQLNELMAARPELCSAIHAARRAQKRLTAVFIGVVSIPAIVILSSAFGLVSLKIALVICALTVASLGAFVIALWASGKLRFYTARTNLTQK
jgi:uncharacterized membrane protein